ncbi:MAG: hypothetical protein EB168_08965 [Euryarchaeota archaeon]|nr:hypothetical protein [Euryarchaeota archaeon]
MLIVVSGPDRVGKSTLIAQMAEAAKVKTFVSHHSAPPSNQDNIFDFYREDVIKWRASGAPLAIFDRAWPCSYILEQHRRRNAGHFEDLVDLEIWLNDEVGAVVHLAQLRPWHWSAPLHIEELREEFPDASPWFIRDELVARMQEHKTYSEELMSFYDDVTMFPSVCLSRTYEAEEALKLCKAALRRVGE